MKMAQAVALTILFLLIPHQEPWADQPEAGAQATSSTARSTPVDITARDGYVWSLSASRGSGELLAGDAEHLQTDGYSWSARSERTALDSTR